MVTQQFSQYIQIIELNFFKMIFRLIDWENKSGEFKYVEFTLQLSMRTSVIRLQSSLKLNHDFLALLLNSNYERMFLFFITRHLETLRGIYCLTKAHLYLGVDILHPTTSEPFFFVNRLTKNSWEVQLIPFSRLFSRNKFFRDYFSALRVKLADKDDGVFIYQDLNSGELLSDFYEMYSYHFNSSLDYVEHVLRIRNADHRRFLKIMKSLLCFWITRVNMKLCKAYVRF